MTPGVELACSDNVLPAPIWATEPVFEHVVEAPLIVQLSAVSTPSSRSVTVIAFPTPGATVACTARLCAEMTRAGDSVSTTSSLRFAAVVPTGAAYAGLARPE
jgi:hypothetical protein